MSGKAKTCLKIGLIRCFFACSSGLTSFCQEGFGKADEMGLVVWVSACLL